MRVRVITNGDVTLVGYPQTGTFVEVIRFQDYMLGKYKTRYRVDVDGKTVKSLIDTKAEAVRIARKELKKIALV